MRGIGLLLASLAFTGHASDALEPFARLLVALKEPAAAWQVAGHSSSLAKTTRMHHKSASRLPFMANVQMMADAPEAAAAPAPAPAPEGPEPYELLDIRVGKIVEAWEHPNSTKLWVEKIEVGEDEPRQIASGLREFYATKEDMEGQMVLVVCNLKTAKLGGVPSAGMVLCASSEDRSKVVFVQPPEGAEPGQRVLMEGKEEVTPATPNQVNKKKWMQKAAEDLKAVGTVATYKDTPLMVNGSKCISPAVSEGTIS